MARVFKHTYTKPLPQGADLFTRKGKHYARFKDGKDRTATAPLSQDGKKVVIETAKWYIEYKDADGIMRRVPGCKDRQAAAKMASDLESAAERGRTGLIDRHAAQRQRPLAEHLAEWEIDLLAKGNTQHYVHRTIACARAILENCQFRFWSDVSASSVQTYLGELREAKNGEIGPGANTANDYLRSIKQFMGWMVRDNRAPNNPVAHLQRFNTKTDIRRQRRPLSPDECRVLISTASCEPIRNHLTGPERVMLYRLALESGFRRAELQSLMPVSFTLDEDPPTVTVRAAYSKHRREDVQPIPRQLADDLKIFLAGKPAEELIFPNLSKIAHALRADLASAGIPSRDSAGRVVDFHALRHTYITNLTREGVAPKIAMDLARHASVELTMNYYSHTLVADRAKALSVLPNLTDTLETPERVRLTGTYDGRGPESAVSVINHKQDNKPANPGKQKMLQPVSLQVGTRDAALREPSIPYVKTTIKDAKAGVSCQELYKAEHERTEAQQEPVNKGHSEAQVSGQNQVLVPQEDSASTEAEHCAAKLNHKQDNKRILQDPELASVIDAWPVLPEAIKAGILAMVKAYVGQQTAEPDVSKEQ